MQQQQPSHHEQIGNQPQIMQHQQQQQPMMLCPVRLVYDTPLLMQPGDQVQNQNIFINPQNPPPWARPVQNQVIYVQQLPQNMVQMMDQNQIFVQPSYNYPQMIQQQIMNQQEQLRPMTMQIPNMIPSNLIQNLQTNVANMQNMTTNDQAANSGQNVSNIAHSIPNYGHQQIIANTQNLVQNQVNIAPDNRQIINIQQQIANQNIANQKAMETQRQIYRPVMTQMTQQIRPQVVQNSIQNSPNIQGLQQLVTNVNPNYANNNRLVQNQVQNQPIQIQSQIFNQQPLQQNQASQQPVNQQVAVPNTQDGETKIILSNSNTGATVTYSAVRNGQSYTYRAIQPKPPAAPYRHILPNVVQQPQFQRPVSNLANTINYNQNAQRPAVPNVSHSTVLTPTTIIKTESINTNFNKKRKSESPDEVQKKMATNSTVYGSITVTAKLQEKILKKSTKTSSEIGTNTSPIPKNEGRNSPKPPTLQINPMDAQINKFKQEKEIPQLIKINNEVKDVKIVKDATQQTEKDKFVRNTVFPQSQVKGRVLNDKPILQNIVKIENKHMAEDLKVETTSLPNNLSMPILETESPLVKAQTYIPPYFDPHSQTYIDQKSGDVIDMKVNYDISSKLRAAILQTTDAISQSYPVLSEALKMEIKPLVPSVSTVSRLNEDVKNIKIEKDKSLIDTAVKTEETAIISKPPVNTKVTKPNTNKKEKNNVSDVSIKSNDSPVKTEALVKKEHTFIKPREIMSTKEPLTKQIEMEKPKDKLIKGETLFKSKDETIKPKEVYSNGSNFRPENNDIMKDRKEYTNLSVNDMKNKEIRIVNGNVVKEERDFVLTHVLDGYVIQESNVPFAIRRPLKEKTTVLNTQTEDEKIEDKKQVKVENTEIDEKRKEGKILELSHLNLNEANPTIEVSEKVIEEENKSDNPFDSLSTSTLKSWTVEQLTCHLSKYNWQETVTLFREHEIDGESLFLVSKTQLLTIGVGEMHADLICDFVTKNK